MNSRNGLGLFAFAGSIALAQVLCQPLDPSPTPAPEVDEDLACPYLLPYSSNKRDIKVSQGNLSSGPSHLPGTIDSHAFDFDLVRSDPVLAARGGRVHGLVDGNTECGLQDDKIDKANYVIIDHEDGTYAIYKHLLIGVEEFVEVDQIVDQGQQIGEVGNTGYTDCEKSEGGGHHLHFAVLQTPEPDAQSFGACFSDVPGDGVPQEGNFYTSSHGAVVQGGASVTPKARVESIEISQTETPEPPTATAVPPTDTPEPILVEEFLFDTARTRTSGSVPLEQGTRYTVTVYGTMSYWAAREWPADSFCGEPDSQPQIPSPGKFNGIVGTDFAFTFSAPFWSNSCERGLSYPYETGAAKISLDNGARFDYVRPIGNTYNKSHTYRYVVVGAGSPLQISWRDSYYPDNYGQFSITIETN